MHQILCLWHYTGISAFPSIKTSLKQQRKHSLGKFKSRKQLQINIFILSQKIDFYFLRTKSQPFNIWGWDTCQTEEHHFPTEA